MSGGDAFFDHQFETFHVRRIGHVRAAAEFLAVVADRDHADRVGVLFAEQHHRAGRSGFGQRNGLPSDCGFLFDFRHHVAFDLGQDVIVDRLLVGEIKSQSIFFDLAALLLGVVADVQMQGVVQQVCRRVARASAPRRSTSTFAVQLAPSLISPSVSVPW